MDGFHGTRFLPARVVMAAPNALRLEPGMCAPAAVTNWTVTAPGATKAPTSNDYEQWHMDQLRKECTARGKKIKRNIEDEGGVRRRWLRENDMERQRAGSASGAGAMQPVAARQPVAVGNKIAAATTVQHHEPVKRADECSTPPISPPIHVISPDPRFDGPSFIAPRSKATSQVQPPVKLPTVQCLGKERDMHRTVLRSASVQVQNPKAAITLKPTEAARVASDRIAPPLGPTPPLTRDVSEVLDCLSKTYTIWFQLQNAVNDMEGHGRQVPLLRQSIDLFEAGLDALEQEYATAMGLEKPKKRARVGAPN